jgi:thiol:disulfide interchange protein
MTKAWTKDARDRRTLLLPLLWHLDDPITAGPTWSARADPSSSHWLEGVQMIHSLLVVAVILFILWLLFHATGGLVNLIWLVIIVLVALWLFGFLRGRSAR